jgi:dihydropteroate synthase
VGGDAAVTQYYRPLGLLSGRAAARAVVDGLALPLAGGPLAFTLVEIIRLTQAGPVRHIARATDMADEVAAHMAPRRWCATGPAVMGIVNATPDSFSDGGVFLEPDKAIAHGLAQIEAGAQIVDIGGESTRPGAAAVDPTQECRRVIPVIAGLRRAALAANVILSVDTRNAATMRAALDAGATMINDVSALTHDPDALGVVMASGALVALMHMQGHPATMQQAPAYGDVALDVYDYLDNRIEACRAAGIGRSRIVIDPGIGFGKTVAHNLALLEQLTLFHGLGAPILIGVSRKGFIGHLSAGEPSARRLPGSLAAGLSAAAQGAQILRVHDVAETLQAIRIAEAIRA